jgi:hypothetical protein
MCCYLPPIRELNKPRQTWCTHCDKRAGCKIYETRPEGCVQYKCAYLTNPALDETWKPSACKFIVHGENGGLMVTVDTARRDAWRREPYYASFKHLAQTQGPVFVFEGATCTFLSGDTEKVLGEMGPNQRLMTRQKMTARGMELEAFIVDREDTLAQN